MSSNIENFFNQSLLPTILVDSNGFVLDINDLFEKTYGYSKKMLIGKPLVTIIPEKLRRSHDVGFSRFLQTEKSTIMNQSLSLSIQHANGTVLMAEHCIKAERIDNKWIFAASIKLLDGKE